jgi:hypothetical protein
MELLLKDAFNKAQDKDNLVGIWWYQIRTGILEYSTEAKGHLDKEYFQLVDMAQKDTSIIRGRLIKVENNIYLIIFSDNSSMKIILNDLKQKIEKESKIKIDFIINYEGYNLNENKGEK